MTRLALGVLVAIAAGQTLAAHHSFAAEFDANRPVMLTGTVTRIEWTNPHIWIYFDVAGDRAAAESWQCEGGAPNTLTRNGWSKESLKPAQQVTVYGWQAKDGSKTCNMRAVKLPDGRDVFAGSSNGDAPTPPKK